MVINARFAKPLDTELILDVANHTKKMVIVEENILSGGFGAAVLELLEKAEDSDVKVKRLGIPDEFVTHGEQDFLRSFYHLDAPGIAKECADFLAQVQAKVEEEFPPLSFNKSWLLYGHSIRQRVLILLSHSLELVKLGDCFQRRHGINVKLANFIS